MQDIPQAEERMQAKGVATKDQALNSQCPVQCFICRGCKRDNLKGVTESVGCLRPHQLRKLSNLINGAWRAFQHDQSLACILSLTPPQHHGTLLHQHRCQRDDQTFHSGFNPYMSPVNPFWIKPRAHVKDTYTAMCRCGPCCQERQLYTWMPRVPYTSVSTPL